MRVFLDYDQAGLDRAYDQAAWAPNRQEVLERRAAASEAMRARLGEPEALPTAPPRSSAWMCTRRRRRARR